MRRGESRAKLPDICVLEITGLDGNGEALAAPVQRDARHAPPHIILHTPASMPAPAVGARVLARLETTGPRAYRATLIKALERPQPKPVIGIFTLLSGHGIIESIDRKNKDSYSVALSDSLQAASGELVVGESMPGGQHGMPAARITERLGALHHAGAASLIAIHLNRLPTRFSDDALRESEIAAARMPLPQTARADLRDLPLITIDGEDARDFDDAVYAQMHDEGWHIVVAIADVAHYVYEDSALDAAAYARGNSAYFPDRVLPMLPEALSNGVCSLRPAEDRYCLAVHLWIDAAGRTQRYRFERGLMRSHARMTYTQAQALADSGNHPILTPLYGAYEALTRERQQRGALELNLPEYIITLNASGQVQSFTPKERLESHRLIEAYMIAANVAAADFLLRNKGVGCFRVHEPPDAMKLKELRAMLEHMGYRLSKGEGIRPQHFNKVLERAAGAPEEFIVNQSILRAQMQAYYSPKNLGHFGLGLERYCHFTSPIRRYADLLVHREIIRLLQPQGSKVRKENAAVCEHISLTERKAMQAERDAMDRYRAAFMADKKGQLHAGTITGVAEAGLFITLPAYGVTGFMPMRALAEDFFHYDKTRAQLIGRRSRKTYTLGDAMMIEVREANGITGNLIFAPAPGDRPPRLTKPPHTPKKYLSTPHARRKKK